jgi:AraC family transcriptional regulator of adaptative response / DNA-3-methyladenine glycosylase II
MTWIRTSRGLPALSALSPGSFAGLPVSGGTSATVKRALRLINEGALDNGSGAQLAERLGLTDRHLRRLFLEHVGVPPIMVAETRRLLFAKKSITETHLPFSEIAFSSGYQSLRRFNEAIRDTYKRNLMELRRFKPPATNVGPAIELKLNRWPPRHCGSGNRDGRLLPP